jgi:hypothetical protein
MSAVPPIAAASGNGEGAALHADGNVTRAFYIRELAKVIADQLRAPGGPLVQDGEAAAYPVMRPATLRGLAAKRTIRFEQERPGTTPTSSTPGSTSTCTVAGREHCPASFSAPLA